MSQFTRFFSGKFQNLRNCAGVKNLTNIMSVHLLLSVPKNILTHVSCFKAKNETVQSSLSLSSQKLV